MFLVVYAEHACLVLFSFSASIKVDLFYIVLLEVETYSLKHISLMPYVLDQVLR